MTGMSHGGALTDLEAIRAFARSNDPRAFEILLERYQRMVLATCLRVLGDRGHAEDATQETFLKLARNAGEITCNAGAWLHRCATRTAIDAKRAMRVRRDAETIAVRQAASLASDPAERTWKEIEPLVDAALERLRDEERDVLVTRFLLGRSQALMAEEAGVNPGTMSRRIDKALKRLHTELGKGGVEIAGIGALGGAMLLAARSVVPSAETLASLGKIGLAAGASGGSGALAKAATIAVVAVIGLGTVSAGVMLAGGGSGGVSLGLASSTAAIQGDPVERPRREIKNLTMVHHQIGGPMEPMMICDGSTLEMILPHWDGQTERMKFSVLDWQPGRGSKGTLTLRTDEMDLREGSEMLALEGRTFEADYEIDKHGLLRLTTEIERDGEPVESEWIGAAIGDQDESRPFVGSWGAISPWEMRITKDIVEVLNFGHAVYRFKVLEWDERTSATRVASICVDSMAPQLVGQRVKLLLRETDGLYELAFRQWPRERLDEWPEGFVANEKNALNVLAFRGGK